MGNTVFEMKGPEFKDFILVLKGMIGTSNELNIKDGRIVSSIIGGFVIQEFPDYPDLNFQLSKVKETLNIISAVLKMKIDYVICEVGDVAFYKLNVYLEGNNKPISLHLAKPDIEAMELEVPDLKLYDKKYHKIIDKDTYVSIEIAIKQFENNGKTQIDLELDNNYELVAFNIQDQLSIASLRIPVEDGTVNNTLKLANLYDGKCKSALVVAIMQDKRHDDRFLIITYPESNDKRKCLRFAEIEDTDIGFY